MTSTRYKLTLIAILMLAASLRLTFLDKIPFGLHHQEASVGIFMQKLVNQPLSIFNIRLPFALINIVGLFGLIVLTQKLFPKKTLSLWVGFILATSPWHIWLARTSTVLNILYFIFIWALVFIPNKGKFVLVFLVGILLTVSPIFNDAPFSLLKDTTYTDNLNTFRGQAGTLGQLFFNKSQIFTRVINNFLGAFNPSFIFARGDNNLLNQPLNCGPLLISFLPLCLFGFLKFCKENLVNKQLIFSWILISVLPTLFLINSPQTDKLILLFYPLSLFTALGITHLKSLPKLLISILLIFNLAAVAYDLTYKHNYFDSQTFYPQTLNLAEHLSPTERYWLTDSINPNPIPVIAFKNGFIGNITTGNFAEVESQLTPIESNKPHLAYDTYILDAKQLDKLLSLNKSLKSTLVNDVNGYLIIKLDYEE